MTKTLTLTFVFTEKEDYGDTYLDLDRIERETDLTDGEISALGEEVGQTDRWQVERWLDIQDLLGNPLVSTVEID